MYVIAPTGPLRGEIALQGAKNSILKLMAATLLAEGEHLLYNVPHLGDVEIMRQILASVGAESSWVAPHELTIKVPRRGELVATPLREYVGKIRASVVLLGPLLSRCGEVELGLPGGDDFGGRPIDIHLEGLSRLGAEFSEQPHAVRGVCHQLVGDTVVLEFPSHTATDNMLMAAACASGTTVIDNAAREPEVVDLAQALCQMGAKITGAGTSRIVVEGVQELSPLRGYSVVGDRVAAATYLCALGMVGGEIKLEGIDPATMEILIRKLGAMGFEFEVHESGLMAQVDKRLRAVNIQTLPYPGVATDYKPMMVAMLTRADGVSVVSENLFSGRFRYLEELQRFGANIISEGHHVVIRGAETLVGARVTAFDIRAGAALVIAALGACSPSQILGVSHIERGYDDPVGTLRALGAEIRVEERE